MSVLWRQQATDPSRWEPIPVSDRCQQIEVSQGATFRLVQVGRANDQIVALLVAAGASIHVNGQRVIGGLHILQHRDEIIVRDQRYYYSVESKASTSVFQLAAGQRRPKCAVCRAVVDDGQTIVACPRCGRVFHQVAAAESQPAKECWTYRDKCLCDHPTSFRDDVTWRPEKEECCV